MISQLLKDKAESMGIEIPGTWGDNRLQQEIDLIESPPQESDKFKTVEWAQERAMAIWGGQSTDMTVYERVGRIRLSLMDKGFERFPELKLPISEDLERLLF